MKILRLIGIGIALFAAGCGGTPGALSEATPTPKASAVMSEATRSPGQSFVTSDFTHPPGLPVDLSLTPVSRSQPGDEAAAVLARCLADGNLDAVAGMAQLPGNRVREFMLTNGKEPELQSDQLVWAVQLQGPIAAIVGPDIFDPLCVVIGDQRLMFAPYAVADGSFTPPPDFIWPRLALPPLAP
jgi:hypothetical protein